MAVPVETVFKGLSRRSVGTVRNRLRDLDAQKLIHGNTRAGYRLTRAAMLRLFQKSKLFPLSPRMLKRDTMPRIVTVREPQAHLSDLIARTEEGEDVIITRDGVPARRANRTANRRHHRVHAAGARATAARLRRRDSHRTETGSFLIH